MLNLTRLILSAICVLYIAARIWRLTDSCLWFDEIFSVHAAEHPWGSIWWFVAQDLIHPPLFYVVLKVWINIGGDALLWLRLFPVLFSVLALVPFIYLCRELRLPRAVAPLALGMLAVNGSLIKYTQTVRMYSMLMFLGLLSMWLFARYFYRGKSFVPLVIVNLLLIYTHYFGWLVVGGEVLVLILFQRIKWRRAVVMSAILIGGFVPWILALWRAAAAGSDVGQNIAWMQRPGLRQMVTFLFDLTEPIYFQGSNAEAASIYYISIPILFILVACVIAYFLRPGPDEDRQRIYILALLASFPVVIAFAASWLLPHSVWGSRHLIVIYAPIAILLSYFLIRIPVGWVRIAVVSLLLLFSAYAVALQVMRPAPQYVWCAWDDVATNIKSRDGGATKIYSFEQLVAYHLWFGFRDSPKYRIGVVKGVDVPTDDASYFLPRGFGDVQQVQINEIQDEKIWLAFRTSKEGEEAPIIAAFSRLGYSPCPGDVKRFGSTTVYWLKMTKSVHGCK